MNNALAKQMIAWTRRMNWLLAYVDACRRECLCVCMIVFGTIVFGWSSQLHSMNNIRWAFTDWVEFPQIGYNQKLETLCH